MNSLPPTVFGALFRLVATTVGELPGFACHQVSEFETSLVRSCSSSVDVLDVKTLTLVFQALLDPHLRRRSSCVFCSLARRRISRPGTANYCIRQVFPIFATSQYSYYSLLVVVRRDYLASLSRAKSKKKKTRIMDLFSPCTQSRRQ